MNQHTYLTCIVAMIIISSPFSLYARYIFDADKFSAA